MKPKSPGGQSHKFYCPLSPSIQITDLFLIVCSHTALLVFLTFHTLRSLIFTKLADRLFYRTHDFLQPCELWKAWCLLLSAGFLFTPLCPDSSLALQFTLCGKQDRTLCVGFPSSWHGYRPPTKPDDNAQQPQQTKPTKLHIRVNRVCKM